MRVTGPGPTRSFRLMLLFGVAQPCGGDVGADQVERREKRGGNIGAVLDVLPAFQERRPLVIPDEGGGLDTFAAPRMAAANSDPSRHFSPVGLFRVCSQRSGEFGAGQIVE